VDRELGSPCTHVDRAERSCAHGFWESVVAEALPSGLKDAFGEFFLIPFLIIAPAKAYRKGTEGPPLALSRGPPISARPQRSIRLTQDVKAKVGARGSRSASPLLKKKIGTPRCGFFLARGAANSLLGKCRSLPQARRAFLRLVRVHPCQPGNRGPGATIADF